jgi:sulfate transporter 4
MTLTTIKEDIHFKVNALGKDLEICLSTMNNPSLLEALIGNQTSVRKRGHASVRLDVVDTFSLPTTSAPTAATAPTLPLPNDRGGSSSSSPNDASARGQLPPSQQQQQQHGTSHNSEMNEERSPPPLRLRCCCARISTIVFASSRMPDLKCCWALFPSCWSTWGKTYPWREQLGSDVVAGITVGVMIVPQSLSYAKLAGLPVQWGLYSAMAPLLVYALYGTSRQLAVGPVALASLLLSTGLTSVLQSLNYSRDSVEYQELYQTLAIQCGLYVGLLHLVAGIGQWGRLLTMFLSHAVISGFTTGAAVIIGLSQVKYLVGYDIGKSDTVPDIVWQLIHGAHAFNYKTCIMGLCSILLLLGVKHAGMVAAPKWLRAVGPLLLTVVSVILTILLDLPTHGIPVVGPIPRGFPRCTIAQWSPGATVKYGTSLFSVVASIAVIGFMESIAIAKQLAMKNNYSIDASRELVGLGLANIVGSAFNAFPVAGSFSRTAVNNASGAQSAVSGIVTALLVCLVVLCLTPVFEQLPLNALAAIVIAGVIGLVDYDEAIHLWCLHKVDFAVWCLACTGTMFLGCELGLGTAVAVSVLVVVYESARTEITVRMPQSSTSRIETDQDLVATPPAGIAIVRMVGLLFFASAPTILDSLPQRHSSVDRADSSLEGGSDYGDCEIKSVILDLSSVGYMDSSGLHQIEQLWETCRSREQQLFLVGASARTMRLLSDSRLDDRIGARFFVQNASVAVALCARNAEESDSSYERPFADNSDAGGHP